MLNQELFDRLNLACQKGVLAGQRVRVTNQGVRMTGNLIPDPSSGGRRKKFQITNWGESYNVCCPWCGDKRFRLSVSHMYGVYDAETKSYNTHLLKCYNEDCQQQDGFRQDFQNRIGWLSLLMAKKPEVTFIQTALTENTKPVELPQGLEALTDLPAGHPALVYLTSKAFDPKKLNDLFGVRWYQGTGTAMSSRIIVPIYCKNQLVAWQGRFVFPNGSGNCDGMVACANVLCAHKFDGSGPCPKCQNPETTKVLKWYTALGSQVGSALYNYDTAVKYPYCVVTEGISDVHRLGTPEESCVPGPGVAVFNKKLTNNQIALLDPWRERGTVFLLYDGDAWDTTLGQYERLKPFFGDRIIAVKLPEDKDPGDLEHKEVWNYIYDAAKHAKQSSIFTRTVSTRSESSGVPSLTRLREAYQ